MKRRPGRPAPTLEDELKEIWKGFSTPSLASCIGALLVVVAELAIACCYFVPSRLLATAPALLMPAEVDEYLSLSLRLMRYRAANVGGLQVAYLGASTASRSLLNYEPVFLSRVVSARLGRRVRMNLWSSNGQRYEDALVVADQLSPDFSGAFLIVVNDYKDDDRAVSIGDKRFVERVLSVSSPSRDELWGEDGYVPRSTGVFFLDHLDFFAARRFAAIRAVAVLARGNAPRGQLRPLERVQLPSIRKRAEVRAGARAGHEPPILGTNRRIVDKLVGKLTERGIITVFVEAPLNPKRATLHSPRIVRYYEDMAQFTASRGIVYWNFNGELDFKAEDFHDPIHLESREARGRFQRRLTESIAALLKDRFGNSTPGNTVDDEDEDG